MDTAPPPQSPPDKGSPPSNSNSTSSPPPPSSSNSSSSPPPSKSPPLSWPPPPSAQNSSATHPAAPPTRKRGPSSPSDDSNSPKRSHPPPPRPSRSNTSPPSSKGTPSKSDSHVSNSNGRGPKNSEDSDEARDKIIVGVIVGVGILLLLIILVSIKRRKKKKRDDFYSESIKGNLQALSRWQSPPHNSAPKFYPERHKPQGQGGNPLATQSASNPPQGVMVCDEFSCELIGVERPPIPPTPPIPLGFTKSNFTYEELKAATGGFSHSNILGQGGFGYVYKGILPNGKPIAVKSLRTGSGQGEREFQAEIDIISRVHHRFLVSLEGYCSAEGQRMLVYEFVPNNSLEYHLHGKDLQVMDFPTRAKIALGSAKGLAYLHEDCHPRIIHRDIKSSNILLDFNFEAKVADFGLAKLSSDNNTHVSTRVMGTFGYLAPEYASSGKLSEKSDVFSFGVMLLELITGKKPADISSNAMEDSLVDWARPLLIKALDEGSFDKIADPNLEQNYDNEDMARMVSCAAAGIHHSAKKRPKMSQIVRVLEGRVSLDDLNGVKPGQSTNYGPPTGNPDYSQQSYQQDMKKLRELALTTGAGFPSGEHSPAE